MLFNLTKSNFCSNNTRLDIFQSSRETKTEEPKSNAAVAEVGKTEVKKEPAAAAGDQMLKDNSEVNMI